MWLEIFLNFRKKKERLGIFICKKYLLFISYYRLIFTQQFKNKSNYLILEIWFVTLDKPWIQFIIFIYVLLYLRFLFIPSDAAEIKY